MIRVENIENPYLLVQWNNDGKIIDVQQKIWSASSIEEMKKLDNSEQCKKTYGTITVLDTLALYGESGLVMYYFSEDGVWIKM